RQLDALLKRNPRKRHADSERLTLAVEVAVHPLTKDTRLVQLSRQPPSGQGKTHDDTQPLHRGCWQQFLRRLSSEDVKNDLERGEAFLFQADETFLNRLHTGPKGGNQPFVPLPSKPVKDAAIAQHRPRHTVQLCKVNALDAKTL